MGIFFCFIISKPYIKNMKTAMLSLLFQGEVHHPSLQSKTHGELSLWQPQVTIWRNAWHSWAWKRPKGNVTEIKIQQ